MKEKILFKPNLLFLLSIPLVSIATPVYAHHAMGNTTPNTIFSGLMSGLAHPIIGLDHFAFIIALGFLAGLSSWGMIIPVAFILTSIVGTGIHLIPIDLPMSELIISLSVIIGGLMLAKNKLPNTIPAIILALIAGIFHGYAYGESIIGAETNPLFSYLIGFSLIQIIITFISYKTAQFWLNNSPKNQFSPLQIRFIGCIICGVGISFLSSAFSA